MQNFGFASAVTTEENGALVKKRILVVDDDFDICDALQLILQRTYEVQVAYNGHEAFSLLEREAFDAVVLDLMMPSMDGEELMKAMHERGITVPVVFASAATHLSRRAQQSGAAGWVEKPFDAHQLESLLKRIFDPGSGGTGPKGRSSGTVNDADKDPAAEGSAQAIARIAGGGLLLKPGWAF